MAKNKQRCPDCDTFSLCCKRTCAISIESHELESARQSIWRCTECGAEFELTIPAGKLRRLKKGIITPDLCRRVLRYLGLDARYADGVKEK